MAELLVKVGAVSADPTQYQDGDILCAFNRRHIRCVHAEHICHLNNFGFTRNGLRPDSLARTFLETTSQYRFERVSLTEVRRVDLAARTAELFGPNPNAKGEQIHVEEYLARRLTHPSHAIFGVPGVEVWYGGRRDVSNVKLDKVWTAIESQTPNREATFSLWPLTATEKRHMLALSVDEFDDLEAERLVAPSEDAVGQIVRKRNRFVDWKTVLSGVTVAKVSDPLVEVDNRTATPLLRSAIVATRI